MPDEFLGTVDEFYVVPDPLPPGEPGELIRIQHVSAADGVTTKRIMYHSVDAAGRDRAVTGIVTYPDAPAPDGGWPVLSIAPGTTGLASPCATSRSNAPASTLGIPMVGVRTDYIGLGPVGELQPYLSRVSEAHAVIDAVRAARNIPDAHAGDEWLVLGGSQGGHSTIAAHELGEEWAPELELLGAVSLAPAAMFGNVYGDVDRIVTNIVGVMALYGGATENPQLIPDDYVGPQTAAVAAAVLPNQCLGAIIDAFVQIPVDEFYAHDPAVTEPARSIMQANDVGHVAVDSPLLLVQGTADVIVNVQRTRDLFARLCATGQVTEYTEYEGATHDDIGAQAFGQAKAFIEARLAGRAAVDSCGEPTSTTSTPTSTSGTTATTEARPRFTG